MGTYHGIGGDSELNRIQYSSTPTAIQSVSSVDTKNAHGQSAPRYEVVETQRRDSFDSLEIRPESPDPTKREQSGDVGAQSPRKLKASSTWERGVRVWHYGWVAETVGLSLAIISLIAILIVLLMYQGRQKETWPLFITINAYIAIFTVLLKAGLALPLSEGISQLKWQWFQQSPRSLIGIHDFDEASRDAWTSLLFMFSIEADGFEHPRHFWQYPGGFITYLTRRGGFSGTKALARFGALLTVLAFAADPFSQQIVEYVDCPQNSTNSQASVARTNSYMAQGGHTGAMEADIDSPMAVAINTGLVNPPANIASLVNIDCVSGNCTFPQFQTVGVCHACQDITSSIHNMTGAKGSTIHNYTLQDPENGDTIIWIGMGTIFSASAPTVLSTLENIMELKVLSNADQWKGLPSAYACQLQPCLRTYEASVSNSVRTERVVNTRRMGQNQLFGKDQDDDALFKLATSQTLRNGSLAACEPHAEAADGLVKVAREDVDRAPNIIAPANETVAWAWYEADCVWTFGFSSASVVRRQLSAELDGAQMQLTGGVTTGPIVAKNMWRNGTVSLASLDTFVAALADTITATVRNRGERAAAEYAAGQVLVGDTCVAVRWPWFSYPAVLVGLGAVFFLLLVAHTPRGEANRLWKSSTLAMLFAGVDESISRRVGFDASSDEIKDVAKSTRARLVRDEKGRARFV